MKSKIKNIGSKKLKEFKNLRKSRKIGVILYVVSIASFQVSSLASLGATLGFSQVLSDIRFPAGFIHLNLDVVEPENLLVAMPYEIDNGGVYYLTDIKVSVNIRVNYLNQSNLANITALFFSKSSRLPDVRASSVFSGFFEGDFRYFDLDVLTDMYNYSDAFEPKLYYMDLMFSAVYFLGLMRFSFSQINTSFY